MEEENKLEEQTTETEKVEAVNAEETSVEEVATVEAETEVKEETTSPASEESVSVPKKSRKEIKAEKEKARLAEYEGLSDDELYTKLQTEKMLRRKRNTRIASIVGLCAVFALAIVVIVLSVVPVSLVPRYLQNDFVYMSLEGEAVNGVVVKLHNSNTQPSIINNSKEQFEKFKDLFDESFAQTYISAIFSGNLAKPKIDEFWNEESTVLNKINNEYYVSFDFNRNQEFTYSDGSKYTSTYYNEKIKETFDGTLTFKKAYIVLSQTEGFQDTKVYIVANNYVQRDPKTKEYKTVERIVEVTIRANTYKIFEQWDSFFTK